MGKNHPSFSSPGKKARIFITPKKAELRAFLPLVFVTKTAYLTINEVNDLILSPKNRILGQKNSFCATADENPSARGGIGHFHRARKYQYISKPRHEGVKGL